MLLVDQSGSMQRDHKQQSAASMAIFMAKELEKAGIPFSIRGFECGYHKIKDFEEKIDVERITSKLVISKYVYGGEFEGEAYGGENHDFEALATAYDEV